MRPRYDFGESVRVLRNVRNDGTFPGMETGTLLVRRGSVGYVRAVGTFLQDQLIYSVHFIDQDITVGCREEELLYAEEAWVPSLFEFRDKVISRVHFTLADGSVIEPGSQGDILKVLRDRPDGVGYHVRFPGHTLMMPEGLLQPVEGKDEQ